MQWLLVAVVVVAVVVGAGVARGQSGSGFCPPPPDKTPVADGTGVGTGAGRGSASAVRILGRDEVTRLLASFDAAAIAQVDKPPPPMAMCYAPKMRDQATIDYVCPSCHSKTQYQRDGFIDPVAMRRLVDELRGLPATLDETRYCAKCSNGANSPVPTLVVQWPDGTKASNTVYSTDLYLLKGFLAGEASVQQSSPGNHVLKKAKRLHELLGLPPEKPLPEPSRPTR